MSEIKDIISRFSAELEAAIRQEVGRQLLAAAGLQGAATTKTAKVSKAASAPVKAAKDGGRRVRRSPEQLQAVQAQILKTLSGGKKLTSEQIQEATGLEKEDLQRPLQLLRDEKRVKTAGQKRAMTYALK